MTSALGFVVLCEILGLAALPLAGAVFGRRPGTIAFAKPLGLLSVGWLAWWLGSLGLDPGIGLIAAAALAVFLAGTLLAPDAWRWSATTRRDAWRRMASVSRSSAVWVPEAVFLASFAAVALLVAHAPDVWGTEKPMDMALVNALTSSGGFPPRDPWLAGTELDGYYYLGHWLAALALIATGVEPTVGYNLALAAFFALSASAAYGLGAALARSAGRRAIPAGLALVFVVLVAGNLASALQLADHEGPLRRFPWFQASRVVPDTINEFPAFSWLLGDLHAHLLAVPFTLLALAIALRWLERPATRVDVAVAAIVCGSLYAINSWSYPVTCGLLVLALAASPGTRSRRLLHAGLLVAAGLVAIGPFLLRFDAPAAGVELVAARRTLAQSARDSVLTIGLSLWLVGSAYLAVAASRSRNTTLIAVGLTAAAVAGGALSGHRLGWVALLLAATGLAAWQLHRSRDAAAAAFVWLTAFGGLTCLALSEVVFVSDAFAGTALERMNTVFKFGYQAWLLLGASGVAAFLVFLPSLSPRLRLAWSAGAALLAAASAAFPLAGAYARTDGFAGPARLDGLGWLAAGAPGDVAAIAWLRRHAVDDAVVLETAGDDYSPTGHARISTFTGRSTVVGWAGHVLQWGEDPRGRRDDVSRLYREPDPAAVRPLLKAYGVDYVVVGPLERSDHGTGGEAKWDSLGRRVFERSGTTIWRLG